MKRLVGMACLLSWIAAFPVVPIAAQTLGMIVDNATRKAVVFNADTDTVTGSVSLGGYSSTGDCLIDPTRGLGFVTDFQRHVWAINLSPAGLPSAPNPIPIATTGEDISLRPNAQHLVVCDGASWEPVSVIDVATRTQIFTFATATGEYCNSVEFASNDSVLVSSSNAGNVRRLYMSPSGTLSDTGEAMSVADPNNTVAAPGGASGVVLTRSSGEVRSFTIPGLMPADTRVLSPFGIISGVISPAGNQLFVRDNGGAVSAFGYNSATGAMSATPFVISIASTLSLFGIDQMAIHPKGDKLYVSQPGAVEVFSTSTGALLNRSVDSSISGPTGVCLPSSSSSCSAPAIAGAVADKPSLWPPNHKMVDVTIDYTATSNCPGTCTLSVTSNESPNGAGDGNTAGDWLVVDAHHVQLRAEHAGRSYTITITCTNATGPTSTSLTVLVRDRR